MNIKFIVSKNYNHFFFVQTLAGWHFSCRSQYAKEWLRKMGSLTIQESRALLAFRSVLEKYGFKPIKNCQAANAFDFFMRFDKFEGSGPFLEKEIQAYQDVMKLFESRFNKIWAVEGVKLDMMEKLLSENFSHSKDEIIDDLKTLFKREISLNKEISAILLLSAGDGAGGGGANNGPDIVSLECSSTNPKDINYLLSTLWHEIIHLALDDYIKKTALIIKKSNVIMEASAGAEKIDFNYSKELLSFSIFSPMSFLTGKYFSTEISKKLNDAVLANDTAWLLKARYVFAMYLIYLNGQFIKKMIDANQAISPTQMAGALIANHELINDFFSKNNKKVRTV